MSNFRCIFLFLLLAGWYLPVWSQGLSGTYTIGGASPDYASFHLAVSDLSAKGVAGPVHFKVRSGTFNERITISPVSGASQANTITFQSETGNRSDVILTYAGTNVNDRPTVLMNGADHFRFRDMSIIAAGVTQGACFWLTAGADSNSFVNLALKSDNTQVSNTVNCIVVSGTATTFAAGNSGSGNLLDSLDVFGGSYGIYMRGISTIAYNSGNKILNSNFSSQYTYPIYVYSQNYPVINNNRIQDVRNAGNYGIYLNYVSNMQVENNIVNVTNFGIYAASINRALLDNTFKSTIVNNMISSTGNYALYMLTSSNDVKIVNNTFRGNISGSGTVRIGTGVSNIDFRNNLLRNDNFSATAYSLYSDASSSFSLIDANNYSSEICFVYFGGIISDMTMLRSNFPAYNQASYSVPVDFISTTDLSLSGKSFVPRGVNAGVTHDIKGNTRIIANPAIGAHEGAALQANNASASSFLTPAFLFCPGIQNVKLQIANSGNNTLTSVTVNWSVNDVVQAPVHVNTAIGAAGSGNNTFDVSLGSINFPAIGQTYLKAWTSAPNGNTDANTQDDTVKYSFRTILSGNYTIGGSNPDFATFGAAVTALSNYGVCGPVNFSVRAGTYTERVTIPAIAGASAINTITFTGSGKGSTLVTYASVDGNDRSTIGLAGADYVTLRDMSIANTGTAYGAAVWLYSQANYNNLVNLDINTDSTTTNVNIAGVVISLSYGCYINCQGGNTYASYNLFDSLYVKGGGYGLAFLGNGAVSGSAYNTVRNSYFSKAFQAGMYVERNVYLNIKNNVVENVRSTSGLGINLVVGCANVEILSNSIRAPFTGLNVSTVNTITVANNMVVADSGIALNVVSTTLANIWHNALRTTKTSDATVVFGSDTKVTFQNNHIRNDDPSASGYAFRGSASFFTAWDYNNYSSAGGFVNTGTAQVNLAGLKSATTPFNQHSYAVDPYFISATNLRTTRRDAGIHGTHTAVGTDIDGVLRNDAYPAIGVHEMPYGVSDNVAINFLAKPIAGFCGTGKQDVIIEISNMGNNVVNSAAINWEMNGVAQAPFTVAGPIPVTGNTGNTITVKLADTLAFSPALPVVLKAWITQTNGVVDGHRDDDTLLALIKGGLSGVYTIGSSGADYRTFGEAVDELKKYGVCGPVTFNVQPGVYYDQLLFAGINRVSNINTITFKGADSVAVVLKDTIGPRAIWIDAIDHITFTDMSIEAKGTAIQFESADTLVFRNLRIVTGITGVSGLNSRTGLIESISVTGGERGINLEYCSEFSILKSTLLSQLYAGIGLQMTTANITVKNNYIYSYVNRSGTSPAFGGYIAVVMNSGACQNFDMQNNRIYSIQAGIYPNYAYGSYGKIINNILHTGAMGIGTYFSSSIETQVYHNTIYNVGSTATGYALYTFGNSKVDFRNNHLISTTANAPMYLYSLESNFTFFDNNHFSYLPGSKITIGYYNNNTDLFNNLDELKNAYPRFNTASVENALNLNADLYAPIDLPGTYVGVDYDINGKPRCKTAPAIGANEASNYTLPAKLEIFPSVDTAFAGSPLQFTSNFAFAANGVYEHQWYVNGTAVTDSSVLEHTFTTPGSYIVALKAGNCMMGDSTALMLQVNTSTSVPVPDFYAPVTLVEETFYQEIQFVDISKHGPTSWNWSASPASNVFFADATAQHALATFAESGTYDICLTTGNALGAGITTCKEAYITVLDDKEICLSSSSSSKPAGRLTDNGGKKGNYGNNKKCTFLIEPCASEINLRFREFSLADEEDLLNIYDGNDNTGILLGTYLGGTGKVPQQLTANSGRMFIEFITGDSLTASGFEAIWTSVALPEVKADFEVPATIYQDEEVLFKEKASGTRLNYTWDFDIAAGYQGGNGENAQFAWSDTGSYDVSLLVSSCNGKTDSITKNIRVIAMTSTPVADFYAEKTRVKAGNSLQLFDLSTQAPVSWRWELSPSAQVAANVKNPRVTFSSAGLYTVKLFVSNALGTDSTEKTAYIEVYDYCQPVVNVINTDIGISKVIYGSVQHSSVIGNSRYSDYSNTLAAQKVQVKGSLAVSMERNTTVDLMGRKIWVDWNQDGDFDDLLELVAFETPAKTVSYTAMITVPSFAKPGFTIMRASAAYRGGNHTPCGVNGIGEFEDYLLEIVLPPASNPTVSLNGNANDSIAVYGTFSDPGATAIDFLGNNINNPVSVQGTINTNRVGEYTLWYVAVDLYGNSDSVSRRVVVYDNVAPQASFIGSDTLTVEVFAAINDPGINAGDNYYTSVAVFADSSVVNTAMTGIYQIVYKAVDSSGNTTTLVRKVKVVDTQAPQLILLGSDTVEMEVFTRYFETGARVTDNYCPGSWNVTGTVDTSVTGEYTLSYVAYDCAGNASQAYTRVVKVSDRTAPLIRLTGADFVNVLRWDAYADSGYSVSDNYSPVSQVRIDTLGDWVNSSEEGLYYIRYRATDAAGNTSLTQKRVIDVRGLSAVSEKAVVSGAMVYPNPNKGRFTVDFTIPLTTPLEYTITDMTGRKVHEGSFTQQQNSLALDGIAPGIYQLTVICGEKAVTFKVSILR